MINNFDVADSTPNVRWQDKNFENSWNGKSYFFLEFTHLPAQKKYPRAGVISTENWIILKFKFSNMATNLKKSAMPLRKGGQKMAIFAYFQYYKHAYVEGEGVQKA